MLEIHFRQAKAYLATADAHLLELHVCLFVSVILPSIVPNCRTWADSSISAQTAGPGAVSPVSVLCLH